MRNEFVHVRRMPEADHFPSQPRQFFHQTPRFRFRLQSIRGAKLFGIEAQNFTDNLAGLHRAHIGAG
jgi:hypothetical protein